LCAHEGIIYEIIFKASSFCYFDLSPEWIKYYTKNNFLSIYFKKYLTRTNIFCDVIKTAEKSGDIINTVDSADQV